MLFYLHCWRGSVQVSAAALHFCAGTPIENFFLSQPKRLMRMGVFTALAIAIHNFPEGLATFVSALQEPGVAGIMVFISFDELLPAAREYGEHHLSIYGLISGMVVMTVSLLLFL